MSGGCGELCRKKRCSSDQAPWGSSQSPPPMSDLSTVVEVLASDLRATEAALAQWRAHAGRLHAELKVLRRLPDESSSMPKMLAGLSLNGSRLRPRECSTSSMGSFISLHSSPSPHATGASSRPTTQAFLNFPNFMSREFWDQNEAQTMQRRQHAAISAQSCVRGFLQRRRYRSLFAYFAIVNGAVDLRSSVGKSVPAYTLTVVRGGRCWQVSHRYSDWLELDRQIAKCLPAEFIRPVLPARHPFRSARITSYRQFALNK